MSDDRLDRRSLLRQEGSHLSDTQSSIASPTVHARQGHHRMNSQDQQFADPAPKYASPTFSINEFGGLDHGPTGLGIRDHRSSIPRRPVPQQTSSPETPNAFTPSSSTRPSPNTAPGSSNPLFSPAWTRNSGECERLGQARDHGFGDDTIKGGLFVDGLGAEGERRSINDNDNDKIKLLHGCPAKHDIHSSRKSWLSISILILSIYSTLFSGIWLMLAIIQPRYGRMIHSGGKLTPGTASIIFALVAKTIELSFVTVFVTFLGQVLSRRSLIKASRGVTIAELTLRTWVIQPGFMITHGQYLKHAGITILGTITLAAAFIAMFYTTASDAIVSPHLKYGGWETRLMEGLVKTSYANSIYITKYCRTPIDITLDPTYSGSTCLDVEHAGQAYHDSISFLDTWTQIHDAGEGASPDITQRPAAPAMLFDNTTVIGSWVMGNTSNMTAAYDMYDRIINNVTLSMPHAGIFAASRAQRNGILQPEDLAGLGEYSVRASVVSPSLNVLCVNMLQNESDPLVYTKFPHARLENSTTTPGAKIPVFDYQNDVQLQPGQSYLNSTSVDDIFHWGAKYSRQPPIFPQYPIDYNSVINISVPSSDSLYMLIKSAATTNYTICQLRSFLNPFCSTQYNVSGLTGGYLKTDCESSDPMLYSKSTPNPPLNTQPDWRDVGSEFMLSTSLNTGVSDANASTTRLLANLIPTMPGWGAVIMPPLLPTIAETLAVMAGHTLLMSSTDASFYHFWNYTAHILDPGVWEPFNASVASEQYTSGLQQNWQGIFYIVLVLVFATNVFCLSYFFLRSGLVTDYTEPQNLFALAVNSPPSERLSGSCGAGPEGEQLNVDWHVLADESTGHFLIKEGDYRGHEYEMGSRKRNGKKNLRSMTSYSRLSNHRASWL